MISNSSLKQEVTALWTLLSPLKIYRKEFWMIFYASALVNFLMLAPMIYLLQIFDRIMLSQNLSSLLSVTALLAFMYIIMHVSEKIRSSIVIALGLKLDNLYADKLYFESFRKKLAQPQEDPFRYHDDFTNFRQWFTGPGVFGFFDLPWAPIYLYVMFLIHPYLGYLAIILIIFSLSFTMFTERKIGSMPETLIEEEKNINKFAYQHLRLGEIVSVYNLASNFRKKWLSSRLSVLIFSDKYERKNQFILAMNKHLRLFFASAALGLAAYLVIQEQLTLGAMIAAAMLMGRCIAPVDSVVGSYTQLITVRKGIVRLADMLTAKKTFQPIEVKTLHGDIEIQNLFVFSEENDEILREVSLTIESGKITALVGPSGSGKTTLLKSILGLQRYDQGKILFDDIQVDQDFIDIYGDQIGYMSQRANLFSGIIGKNLSRMNEPDAKEVVRVSKLTGVHEFILRLPRGYDTEISGEVSLSGGQIQRLVFARTLYGDPKILLLDEPNSNLDSIGEENLKNVLVSFKEKGYTIIFVSHRKDLLKIADTIVEMRDGKLKFQGSHLEFENYMNNNEGPLNE